MNADWPLSSTGLRQRTSEAVRNTAVVANVQAAVARFGEATTRGMGALENGEELRHAARAERNAVAAHLDDTLGRFADAVIAAGGNVAWATSPAAANDYILGVVERRNASSVVKSKSMVTEEIGLNDALEAAGVEVTETDLGEWIIQLANERPSHIIIPAVHRNRHQIADVFADVAGMTPRSTEPADLNRFARDRLRAKFLSADIGITGVNLGVAETGSIIMVTNEGNGRMCTTLPPVHIAVMGAERVVDTWDQAELILGLLSKSASGQLLTSYTSITTGPRHNDEVDGPEELHVVIVDNGRSTLVGTEFAEMLNCIRCGACLNVCPVYRQIGGHAYGWVYPGPMGSVLTPLLAGDVDGSSELSNATTLCGACQTSCPVDIPLPEMLLALRRRKAERSSVAERSMWRAWAKTWGSPAAYKGTMALGRAVARQRVFGPLVRRLPGAQQWALGRELPPVRGRTFMEMWERGDV